MMAVLVIFLLAITSFVSSADINVTKEVIPVSVYFESYCPDSIRFLTKQLYPAYLSPLAANMNITLIPYGKAKTTVLPARQGFQFECHHGEKECKGNLILACVLRERAVPLSEKLRFINCTSSILMAQPKLEEYPLAKCASVSLSSLEVSSCAEGEEGDELLAEFGDKTAALSPPLTSVPTIVFNNKYDADENKIAVDSFRKALCSKLSGNKPTACNEEEEGGSGILAYIIGGCIAIIVLIGAIFAGRKYCKKNLNYSM